MSKFSELPFSLFARTVGIMALKFLLCMTIAAIVIVLGIEIVERYRQFRRHWKWVGHRGAHHIYQKRFEKAS